MYDTSICGETIHASKGEDRWSTLTFRLDIAKSKTGSTTSHRTSALCLAYHRFFFVGRLALSSSRVVLWVISLSGQAVNRRGAKKTNQSRAIA